MKLPYKPRWLNCLYANLFGYFWESCPICGDMFGGHEWRPDLGHKIYTSQTTAIGVCPKLSCVIEAGKRNVIFFKDNPLPQHYLSFNRR